MKLQNLFVPFGILVAVVTVRISSFLNDDALYENIKAKFTEELDIISLSKRFLGKLEFSYFDEDVLVSSSEEKYELSDGSYYVSTSDEYLISKSNGICTKILKIDDEYSITIRCEGVIITYHEVIEPQIKLYDYLKVGDVISLLNYNYSYYYKVEYNEV